MSGLGYSLGNTWTDWILNTDETKENEADGAEGLAGVAINDAPNALSLFTWEGSLLKSVDITLGCTVAEKNLGCALDEETVGSRATQLDGGTHALLLGVEWEHLDNFFVIASLREGTKTQMITSELEESSLSLGSDEGSLTILLAFKSSRVDSNGLNNGLLGVLGKALRPFSNGHTIVVGQVTNEAEEQNEEQQAGSGATKLSDTHGQAFQLLLQRSGFHFGSNRHHDLAERAVNTDRSCDKCTHTLEDLSARDDEGV
ncbi:unnamed protein product [Clonostachys chloroleuca]|uniref:Uncharacterized protein n=1 Tax=Clonostachys chloroleuca TaxID=1926264 RepID=A0AA35LVR1_9HYPO|nr:unnamed protein product [Clonostachys chloroleuca]